jgi:predicted MFS family arabinose efflux permease
VADAQAEAVAAAPPPTEAAERPSLYNRAFVALCAAGFLAFSSQFLIQPVLPLLVVQRLGGDEALVGLMVAAFSLPSVILRPWMGRLVDEWSTRGVMLAGMATLAFSSVAYLAQSLVALFAVRIVHGTGWAAYNSAGHTMVGRLAPPIRRGEASGIYNLMPALAQMIMPAVGLAVLAASDFEGPFLLAAAMAFGGLFAIPLVVGRKSDAVARTAQQPTSRSLLERGAILPMVIEMTFTSVQALFLIYPPLFALDKGIPIEQLTLYYPVVGLTLVVSRAALAKLSDRVGRGPVLVGGALTAIVGLVVGAFANDVVTLAIAGMLWALAASVASPTAMALAIDRAEPGRMGAAMATYSLGFQLGLGGGAALWGVVISLAGFSAAFLLATIGELLLVGLLIYARQGLSGHHGSHGAAPA